MSAETPKQVKDVFKLPLSIMYSKYNFPEIVDADSRMVCDIDPENMDKARVVSNTIVRIVNATPLAIEAITKALEFVETLYAETDTTAGKVMLDEIHDALHPALSALRGEKP